MAWDNICKSKKQGGLGIRNLKQINKALQAKQIWRIFKSKGEWRDILENKYVANINLKQFINRDEKPKGSIIWNGIIKTKGLAFEKAQWKLGNGEDINFWLDDWLGVGPLWNFEQYNRWAMLCMERFGYRVTDYRVNENWVNFTEISQELKPVMDMIKLLPLSLNMDDIV